VGFRYRLQRAPLRWVADHDLCLRGGHNGVISGLESFESFHEVVLEDEFSLATRVLNLARDTVPTSGN
jgi:hypothetical protein